MAVNEAITLPVWLPKDVRAVARQWIADTQKTVQSYSAFAQLKNKNVRLFFEEHVRTGEATLNALVAIFTKKGMREFWEAVAKDFPERIDILPERIVEAHQAWHNKPVHSHSQHKQQIASLISQLKKMEITLLNAPDILPCFNALFARATKDAERELKRQSDSIYLPFAENAGNAIYNEKRISPLYALYIIDNLQKALEPLSKTVGKRFLKYKIERFQAQDAEKSFFKRAVAETVKEIFTQPRYDIAAKILQAMREDWWDIDAESIRQAQKATKKRSNNPSTKDR